MLPPRKGHAVVERSRLKREPAFCKPARVPILQANFLSRCEESHAGILPVRRSLQVTSTSTHAPVEPRSVLEKEPTAPPNKRSRVAKREPRGNSGTRNQVDAGSISESVEEHLRRHDGGIPSCPRCKFIAHGAAWVRAYGRERDPRSSSPADLVWYRRNPYVTEGLGLSVASSVQLTA